MLVNVERAKFHFERIIPQLDNERQEMRAKSADTAAGRKKKSVLILY